MLFSVLVGCGLAVSSATAAALGRRDDPAASASAPGTPMMTKYLLSDDFQLDGSSSVANGDVIMTAYWSGSATKSYKASDHGSDAQAVIGYINITSTFCLDIDARISYLRLNPLGGRDVRATLQSIDLFDKTIEAKACLSATPKGWFGRDLGRNKDDEQGWTFKQAPPVIGIGANLGDKECRWSNDGCLAFDSGAYKAIRFVRAL